MRLRNAVSKIRQILCGKIESKVWIFLYLAGVWVATYVFLITGYAEWHTIRPFDPWSTRILVILDIGAMLLFLIVFVRNIPMKSFWLRGGLALLALLFLLALLPTF